MGPVTALPIQSINHNVGMNPDPMLIGKIAVGQRILDTFFHLLGDLLQFYFPRLGYHSFGLFTGGLLAILRMDCLSILATNFCI